ncbi:MAG: hypothetical protein IJP03_00190 [Christensenellaceae bacterium]|nr:hypothetical protein [Christensenellaceae bacterium]
MMRDLLLLIKINLLGAFSPARRRNKKSSLNSALGSISPVLVGAFVGLLLMASLYSVYDALLLTFPTGAVHSFALQMATSLVLVFGIYRMPGSLFSFKDRELLYSLPLKNSVILASKLLSAYIENLGFTLLVTLPCWAALIVDGQSPAFLLPAFVMTLFVPMLPMLAASVLAFLLAWLAAKLRAKNLVMIVGSVLIIVWAFSFSFGMEALEDPQNASAATGLMAAVGRINFTTGMYLSGVDGSFASAALYCLCALGLSALFLLVFAGAHRRLSGAMAIQGSARRKKLEEAKCRPVSKALFLKELRGYFHCFPYVMNTIIGPVMLLLGGAALLFIDLGPEFALMGEEFMLPMGGMMLASMLGVSNTCAPCISIEGDRLWILRSAPVAAKAVFAAKLKLNLAVSLPLCLAGLAMAAIGVGLSLPAAALLAVFACAYSAMMGLLGLTFNLRFPRLDYANETAAVKQSASALLTMLVGFAFIIPFVGALLLPANPYLAVGGITLLVMGIGALLWWRLCKKGTAVFDRL